MCVCDIICVCLDFFEFSTFSSGYTAAAVTAYPERERERERERDDWSEKTNGDFFVVEILEKREEDDEYVSQEYGQRCDDETVAERYDGDG